MKFPYEDLWYIRARGPDDKRPADTWGGYGQDFSEASDIYSHKEVKMLPSTDWLLNAYQDDNHMTQQLLIFDLDVHKAPDDFDADRLGVPTNTTLVKSQSGGFHVYFLVNETTTAKESDFEIVQDIPFDVDVRGEFVKHHVVAPSEVPGVENGYTLVQDEPIRGVLDPDEAAASITLDGAPLLRYRPKRGGHTGGYEREDIDPPEDMPKCYAAALTLRKEAPEDENLNTHKVNVLAALCGLASGYDIDTVVDHFIEQFYPGDPKHADREKTEYQVKHIAEKLDKDDYSPPTVLTLQEYGILPGDEWCYCALPGHNERAESRSPYYDYNLKTIAAEHKIEADPYEDDRALLLTTLHLRDALGLKDTCPPYATLVELARIEELPMRDYQEGILGERSFKIARQIFSETDAASLDTEKTETSEDDLEQFLLDLHSS